MTVSTSQASEIFLGNGATNTFTFSFIGVAAEDIQVIYSNPPTGQITLSPSQYTLFLNPIAAGSLWGVGGTVTYPTSGSPIPDGATLYVNRILPLTQTTSISNQGNFYPQAIEQALDKLEMQIQQVSGRTGQFRGTWVTATDYSFGDYVQDGANGANTGNYYMCIVANTSGTWSTDLTNGDWQLVIDSAAIGPIGVVNGTANRITVTNPTTTPIINIAAAYDTAITAQITAAVNAAIAANNLAMHPIGSYYINETVSTNPATLLGFGTWAAVTDVFLVAHGSTYTSTGGAATATLGAGNLPSHQHFIFSSDRDDGGATVDSTTYAAVNQQGGGDAEDYRIVKSNNSGADVANVGLTSNTGSSSAFSIIPPYQAAYIWKRTA